MTYNVFIVTLNPTHLLTCKVWLTPGAGVPCSNAANIGERKTWTQSEFCKWRNSVKGPEPLKMYIWCSSPGDGQTSCKVWLASGERHRYSNKVKTRIPLKFAGVPQTPEPISAASVPKFAILWDMWRRYCCLTSFFLIVDTCLTCKDIARQSRAMVHRWQFFASFFASFLRHFFILYFQRAACNRFQTCILNSH